jgi:amidase
MTQNDKSSDPRPLWQWSATEIATATHRGALSVSEVVEAALDRLDAVNPDLNAVVEVCVDAARAEAKALDASDAPKGPLHGVPVTIKINVDQKGHVTSNGVSAFKDVIAPHDAPVVANLRAAGAVIIGRTNTPEFSFRADTDNPLFGRTHNPWGRHVSAGGSSGGAGASVMAGIGALAHGNDIGGSLRFPASANGAVTVKPGLGRVPAWNPSQTRERGLLAQSMSVQGVIARTADDLHLSMPTLIAADIRDPFHVQFPWTGTAPKTPIKVAVSKDDFGFGLHQDVSLAIDRAASALTNAGYVVEEVEPPLVRETGEIGYRSLLGEVKTLLGPISKNMDQTFCKQYSIITIKSFRLLKVQSLFRCWGNGPDTHGHGAEFMETYPLVLSPFLLQPFFAPARDTEGVEGVTEVLGQAHWSFIMSYLGLPAGTFQPMLLNCRMALCP